MNLWTSGDVEKKETECDDGGLFHFVRMQLENSVEERWDTATLVVLFYIWTMVAILVKR